MWSVAPGARAASLLGRRRRDEAVADASHREHVTGLGGLGLDVLAQPDDEVVDGARVGVLAEAPDVLEHRLAGYRTPLVVDEIAEQVGLHQRQRQRAIADA